MTDNSVDFEKTAGRTPLDGTEDHALRVRIIALSTRKAGVYVVSSAGFEKFPIP